MKLRTRIGIVLVLLAGLLYLVTNVDSLKNRGINEEMISLNDAIRGGDYEGTLSAGTLPRDAAILKQATKHVRELQLYKAFFKDAPFGLLSKEYNKECDCFLVTGFNSSWVRIVLEPSGIDSADYMGSSDFDLWPDSLARIYAKQDFTVVLKDSVMEMIAPIYVNGEVRYNGFIKWGDGDQNLYLINLSSKRWGE